MPVNHVIFIPLVLGVGVYIGWALGAHSVQRAWDSAERRRKRREAEDDG